MSPPLHSPATMARPRPKGWITAKTADINDLYERAVQCPESEVDLVDQAWKELRGRTCQSIREDFCGTAAVAREWVRRRDDNTVIGIDLDTDVLAWTHNCISKELTEDQARRITIINGDVMETTCEPVDCALAMNFSYYIFKQRSELLAYFEHVRDCLVDDGLFLLDAYGGSDSFLELAEDRDLDGFTYVWDQHSVNPISGHVVNHIHFEFPDGSRIDKAFTYEWRLWTLPEIRDTLLDAGFTKVAVYWEGEGEDGEGDGSWTIEERGDPCAGWVAYIAAVK